MCYSNSKVPGIDVACPVWSSDEQFFSICSASVDAAKSEAGRFDGQSLLLIHITVS